MRGRTDHDRRGTGERVAEAADFQGTPLTCPPVAAAHGALLAGAPLLAGLRCPPGRAGASGRRTRPAQAVSVALDTLSPDVPTEGTH